MKNINLFLADNNNVKCLRLVSTKEGGRPNTEKLTKTHLWSEAGEKVLGFINQTNKEVITMGYRTTGNGWADEISVKPGQLMVIAYMGDPLSFSRVRIYE